MKDYAAILLAALDARTSQGPSVETAKTAKTSGAERQEAGFRHSGSFGTWDAGTPDPATGEFWHSDNFGTEKSPGSQAASLTPGKEEELAIRHQEGDYTDVYKLYNNIKKETGVSIGVWEASAAQARLPKGQNCQNAETIEPGVPAAAGAAQTPWRATKSGPEPGVSDGAAAECQNPTEIAKTPRVHRAEDGHVASPGEVSAFVETRLLDIRAAIADPEVAAELLAALDEAAAPPQTIPHDKMLAGLLAGYRTAHAAAARPRPPEILNGYPAPGSTCSCCKSAHWWASEPAREAWRCRACQRPPPNTERIIEAWT